MRHTVMLYLIGHRAGLVLGLATITVAVSVTTGTTRLPLPWLSEGFVDLSVDNLLAVALLAAHVTLLTGELASREEDGTRSWWRADCLGMGVLLCVPTCLAFFGTPGLLQTTLLYLVMFFLVAMVTGPDTAYPVVIVLIVVQTMLVMVVPDSDMIPVFWEPDVRIIGALGVLTAIAFALARRPVKTGTRLRLRG